MTTRDINNKLEKLPEPISDIRQEQCPEDCGCCKVPSDTSNVESSPIKRNANSPSKRSNGRLADNKKFQNPSSNMENNNKGEKEKLKKCSVPLNDIGSRLCLGSININDIDVPLFPENHEKIHKIVDSSLEFTDYKRKNKETPTKTKNTVDVLESKDDDDGSFKSFGFESEEESEKSKSKKNTESGSSDDNMLDKGKKYKLSSDPLFSDDSDDNQKEKEKESCLTQIIKNLNNDEEEKLPKKGKRRGKINGFNTEQDSYSKEICASYSKTMDSKEEQQSLKKQKRTLSSSSSSSEEIGTSYSKTMNSKGKEQGLQKQKRTLSSSSSSLHELIFDSPEPVSYDKANNTKLKKCSVRLYDIGSRLHLDSININDIDALLFTDGHEEINNSVNSSLSKTKKFINHKGKNKKTPIKAKSRVKVMESDDDASFKSFGSESEEESLFQKSKPKDKTESGSSDDWIPDKKGKHKLPKDKTESGSSDDWIPDKKGKHKLPKDKTKSGSSDDWIPDKRDKHKLSPDVFSDDSDDNQKQKEKEKKSQRKTKISSSARNKKYHKSSVLSSDDENDVDEKLPRKQKRRGKRKSSITEQDSFQKEKSDSSKSTNYGKKENIPPRTQKSTKKISSSSSDLEEIVLASPKVINYDKTTSMQLKKCSVSLCDIGSKLSSDSININDLKFTNDLKEKNSNINTSLSAKKKFTDNKKKKKKLTSRDESHERNTESDSSCKESVGSEKGEMSRPAKSKFRKTIESDSSDDFILPKQKRESKLHTSVSSHEEDDDDEQDKKNKKRQSKRKLPKEQETVENEEKEKQLRKQQGLKYHESSDSEEDALEKKKKLPSRSESRKRNVDSDSSFNGSLDSENKKSRKSKYEKKVESDSSVDFKLPKKKKERNISISASSGEDEKDKKSQKRQFKRNLSREKKPDKNEKVGKQLRKRQQVQYCPSSDSEEEEALEKKKKLPPKSESRESSITSDITFKESLNDKESLGSESEESSKPKKSKSKKKAKSDSSDDSILPKKKIKRKASISLTSDEDEEGKGKATKKRENRTSKRNLSKEQESNERGKKEKQLRKRQQVKYCKSSDSEEEDSLEKIKELPSRTKSRKSSNNSDSTFKESLDSESEEESKPEKSKSKKKVTSDSSDDSVLLKEKRKKKSISITSDKDEDEKEDRRKTVKKKRQKGQSKRNLSKERESDESGKKGKQLRKRQQVKYCKSSDSEEEDPLEKEKKLPSKSESHKSDSDSSFRESPSDNESLDSERKKKKEPKKSKSKTKVKSDSSDDFAHPKKKRKKESIISVSSHEDSDDKMDKKKRKRKPINPVSSNEEEEEDDEKTYKKKTIKKKDERKTKRKVNSSSEEESVKNKKKTTRLRKQLQVKYDESSSSEDDAGMSRRKRNSSTEEKLYENEKEEKGLRKRQQVKYYESSSSEDDYMETVEEKPSLNKKSGNKSRSLGTDDPDFESGDSDPDNKTSYEKKGKSSSRKKETEHLSEYEKQLLENKIKNQEFLKAIGMEEAKNDFKELKPKIIRKKKEYSESSNGPKRVSQREKAHINYTEGEIGVVDIESELTRLTFEKLLKFKNVYEDFVEEFKEILLTDDFVRTPVSYNRDVLKLLSVKATTKVANLISPTTVSWYPSSEHLVLAIGNIAGSVTLWNIEESDYLYKFAVHSKKVSKVQFNPCNTSHLISSSWDGTLLCCDMREQKFTEVIRISNSCCTCFDFFSPSSYLVSLTNGGVVTVDRRVRGRGSDYLHKIYTCHDSVINSIHVHPVEKDYFVTAGRDRKVCIWDLRKLARPIIEDTAYSKNVNSAFFSPLSGKYLLTASVNRFCIFDTEKMTEGKLKLCRGILDKFRDKKLKSTLPVWVPNSDDIFTWQNKESREMLQIYDKDFNEYETVTDGVTGIRETIEFHPFKPAIASVSQNGIIRISAEKTDS